MPETASGIYYETRGDEGGEPLLLINGYTQQLIAWHPDLCDLLVDGGLRLILMDNRDVGLSRKYGGDGDHDGGYSMDDMAADAASVLDDLGIAAAHVGGQSMGGIIAQRFAACFPDRLRSLTLIYTTPHMSRFRGPSSALADPTPLDRDGAIRMSLDRWRVAASTGFPFEEERLIELAGAAYDRSYTPGGYARQAAAIAASFRGDQTAALREITVPTVIIHGRDDPYFTSAAALAMGEAIPHSEVHVFAGMGHDLPTALFPAYADAILRTVRRATATDA